MNSVFVRQQLQHESSAQMKAVVEGIGPAPVQLKTKDAVRFLKKGLPIFWHIHVGITDNPYGR